MELSTGNMFVWNVYYSRFSLQKETCKKGGIISVLQVTKMAAGVRIDWQEKMQDKKNSALNSFSKNLKFLGM